MNFPDELGSIFVVGLFIGMLWQELAWRTYAYMLQKKNGAAVAGFFLRFMLLGCLFYVSLQYVNTTLYVVLIGGCIVGIGCHIFIRGVYERA